jgi:SnoaL-like domain
MDATHLETMANEWALYKTAMYYARAMDQNHPELIDRIFTDDALIETPTFTLRGRAEIRAMPAQLKQKYLLTSHAVHNQTVDIHGDRAEGETNCLAHMMIQGPRGGEILVAEGVRYLDKWIRNQDSWQFTKRKVVIEFSEVRTVRQVK